MTTSWGDPEFVSRRPRVRGSARPPIFFPSFRGCDVTPLPPPLQTSLQRNRCAAPGSKPRMPVHPIPRLSVGRVSDRVFRMLLCLWGMGWLALASAPAWAQSGEEGASVGNQIFIWLARLDDLAHDPSMLWYAGSAAAGVAILWTLFQIPRLLRWSRGGAQPAFSRSQTRREAKRAARRGDYIGAGRFYEAAEDWSAAAEAYEQGRALGEAAGVWARQSQWAKAARLYEQGGDVFQAAEMYARLGNFLKASALYQKVGDDGRAAEAAERAGDLERAATLYVRAEAFDRAAELYSQIGQPSQAAELFERWLTRQRLRMEAGHTAESLRVRQTVARRCADLYANSGQPEKAARALQQTGLEADAGEQFCLAGDWETGLDLLLRHRAYDRAVALCRAHGLERRLHVVQGERLAAEGAEAAAAREFEAGELWWRAAEMYERVRDYPKAAEMQSRHGDYGRAAEMLAAAKRPAEAAAALERAGKRREAAEYYQRAGAPREAARVLREVGDFYGAGMLLLQAKSTDEAMVLLQQVGPESKRYLEATVALGDLFLQRGMDGPAREKFEKATAMRPIAPDFVHPTYQLAAIHERQGNLPEALRLLEKVVAEQFDFRDVQARITRLRERLAPAGAPGGEATQVVSPSSRARYRIVKELGRGGMGIVYRAEDEVLQRTVAYKVLPDAIREDPKALEAFFREARIAASLHHPNIVTIFDAGQSADEVYIAMEYVEGRSLQEILEEAGALPLPQAVKMFRQACQSLAHAHGQKIVHRDVKPGNMMITRDGIVKLMDFGLAAVVTQATAKVTSVRGTPYYMAPEQIMGEPISALSDQYSLGCTLYHMVAGHPPFVDGDVLYHHIHTPPVPAREQNAKVPKWLDAVILRTMAKRPERRFSSVASLLQNMDTFLNSLRLEPQSGERTP